MTSPLFSIIVPLFNHEHYIGETICSVLQQSESNFELIIIDDGSTDNSIQIVKSFDDPRISFLFQENLGTHATLNRGLAIAKGTFVAILNSDDTFHPDRLRHALAAFESHPNLEAFFSAYHFIDESSNIVRKSTDILKSIKLPSSTIATTLKTDDEESDEWILTLLSGNVLHTTSNLVIRATVLKKIGSFRPWRYVHDYDFFLRLCESSKIYFDEQPLLNYRFHSSNTLAENAVLSVYETILMIADFLANWHPKTRTLETQTLNKFFQHFFQDLRLYGGERLLLALILSELIFREKGKTTPGFIVKMISQNNSTFQLVAPELKASVARDQLNEHLIWQKTETARWWRKSQELELELNWQREQTDHWWRKSQELESELNWQREQTNHWWSEEQNLNERLTKMNNNLIEANRFLGIPNVKQNCKRTLISILKRLVQNEI